MKVCLKNAKKFYTKKEVEVIKEFIKFINKELSLKRDIIVDFLDKKKGHMTTGSRKSDEIKILAKDRLLVDVLRTLAHEWVHEFQHQRMGLKEKAKVPEIGGPVENMANVLAGIMLKKFQKEYPKYNKTIYSGK